MFIPEFLLALGNDSAENRAWLESLPFLIQQAKENWKLEIGKVYLENASCSYVATCTVDGKTPAVLKIGLPHEEALHEIEGLKTLNGAPTVKLLDFDKATNAMLLEQCLPGTSLKTMPAAIQDEVITDLLKQIWTSNYKPSTFRPLATMLALWNKETYEKLDRFPNPGLAKEACLLKERLIASTKESVLLATDLHAGNVLQAQRKDWLAIDLKPYIGDPAYDLTQHILNHIPRLKANPNAVINRLASLAGLSSSRLTNWLFARLASENNGVHQGLAAKLKLLS